MTIFRLTSLPQRFWPILGKNGSQGPQNEYFQKIKVEKRFSNSLNLIKRLFKRHLNKFLRRVEWAYKWHFKLFDTFFLIAPHIFYIFRVILHTYCTIDECSHNKRWRRRHEELLWMHIMVQCNFENYQKWCMLEIFISTPSIILWYPKLLYKVNNFLSACFFEMLNVGGF